MISTSLLILSHVGGCSSGRLGGPWGAEVEVKNTRVRITISSLNPGSSGIISVLLAGIASYALVTPTQTICAVFQSQALQMTLFPWTIILFPSFWDFIALIIFKKTWYLWHLSNTFLYTFYSINPKFSFSFHAYHIRFSKEVLNKW